MHTQNENGDAAATPEVERLASLERQAAETFPEVSELRLVELEEGELPASQARYIAITTLAKGVSGRQRPPLGCRVVEYFAGQGLMVEPAIYEHGEWKELLAKAKNTDWSFYSGMGRATGLHPLYRAKPRYPTAMRKHLLSSVRGYQGFAELVQREAPFPLHVQAALLRTVMREALQLLFATRGLAFDQEPELFSVFQREFVATRQFSKDHLSLYYQICGLARQARHAHDLDSKSGDELFEWNQLTQRVRGFLGAFERYAETQFSSEQEHKRRRIFRIALPASVVAILIGLLVGFYLHLQPIEPLQNTKLITKPGGIKGTYYEGVFKKKIVDHVDTRISMHTTSKPIPEVPADHFSVRWTGYLQMLREDKHAICIESEDSGRLWFNGKLLIDDWKPHNKPRRECATVRVKKGWYPIRVEFREIRGLASMRLRVGHDDKRSKVVQPKDLCCQE